MLPRGSIRRPAGPRGHITARWTWTVRRCRPWC